MKVDLILVSAITASDGSVVASGATLKFDSEFHAASTDIRIMPQLYRNRELFETGYTSIQMSEEVIPNDFIIVIEDVDEFYQLTPYQLYEKVGVELNNFMGGDFFELITIP